MDMSTSHFLEAVPDIDANPEHKRLNLYTRALVYHFFVVRHVGTSTARHARQARHVRYDARVVTCRDCEAASGIWALAVNL